MYGQTVVAAAAAAAAVFSVLLSTAEDEEINCFRRLSALRLLLVMHLRCRHTLT